MENEKKGKGSIIVQVCILFALCVVVTGIITYYSQYRTTHKYVIEQTELSAARAAKEVIYAIEEYPARNWLVNYWYAHADEMDIEYDAYFTASTKTEKKCQLLNEKHPTMELRYLSNAGAAALSPEDQKLFAEIMYTWVLTRLNEIKSIYKIDFLFFVVTEEPYNKQFFLISAADRNAVRGTDYEQVYPIGVVSEVGEAQQTGMAEAIKKQSHIASAGKYVDYYSYAGTVGDSALLVGLTYNLSEIMDTVTSQTWHSSWLAMMYQILYSLIAAVGIWHLVLKPLKIVQKSIRRYKDNKDSKDVVETLSKIKYDNEIGELSTDVTELSHEMDDYLNEIKTITTEKERIEAELSLASRIQSSSLPHIFPPFPDNKEFDIYASMDPAKEVGGDFYDYYMVDDDHLALLIADVSGKGVPAALFMMVSQAMLKTHALTGDSPAKVLSNVNDAISANNHAEMFVTVWLGILEISTGKVVAANAGHEYPAIMHAKGEFELLKDKHGLVIGGMEGVPYKEYEFKLEPGSKLFVYTDGVPEATAAGDEMFGTERMIEALNKEPEADPEGILKRVRKSVDDFVKDAEQFDDLTMLCLEYHGAK